jgi:hypothetical protein
MDRVRITGNSAHSRPTHWAVEGTRLVRRQVKMLHLFISAPFTKLTRNLRYIWLLKKGDDNNRVWSWNTASRVPLLWNTAWESGFSVPLEHCLGKRVLCSFGTLLRKAGSLILWNTAWESGFSVPLEHCLGSGFSVPLEHCLGKRVLCSFGTLLGKAGSLIIWDTAWESGFSDPLEQCLGKRVLCSCGTLLGKACSLFLWNTAWESGFPVPLEHQTYLSHA